MQRVSHTAGSTLPVCGTGFRCRRRGRRQRPGTAVTSRCRTTGACGRDSCLCPAVVDTWTALLSRTQSVYGRDSQLTVDTGTSKWTQLVHNGHSQFKVDKFSLQWAQPSQNKFIQLTMDTVNLQWIQSSQKKIIQFTMDTVNLQWAQSIQKKIFQFTMGTVKLEQIYSIYNGHAKDPYSMGREKKMIKRKMTTRTTDRPQSRGLDSCHLQPCSGRAPSRSADCGLPGRRCRADDVPAVLCVGAAGTPSVLHTQLVGCLLV